MMKEFHSQLILEHLYAEFGSGIFWVVTWDVYRTYHLDKKFIRFRSDAIASIRLASPGRSSRNTRCLPNLERSLLPLSVFRQI